MPVIIVFILLSLFLYGKNEPKKENIKIWIMPNSVEPKEDLKKVLKTYEEENNVEVDITVLDWWSAWDKIMEASIKKEGPDVLQLGTTWVGAVDKMGIIADMKDDISAKDMELFLKPMVKFKSLYGSNSIKALPWTIDIRTIYYRKDVLEKAGIKPEAAFENWDSLKETCRKINGMRIKYKKLSAFGHTGRKDWNIIHQMAPFIWGAGGDFISEDGQRVLIDSKEVINGIEYFISYHREGLSDKNYVQMDYAQLHEVFRKGKVAIIFDGPWSTRIIDDAKSGNLERDNIYEKVGVASLPKGPKGKFTFMGGTTLSVCSYTKKYYESLKLVKYLTMNLKVGIEYSKYTGGFPGLSAVENDDFVKNSPERKAIFDSIKFGRSYPCISSWGPIETILTKRLGNIWEIAASSDDKNLKRLISEELKNAKKEMELIVSDSKLQNSSSKEGNEK